MIPLSVPVPEDYLVHPVAARAEAVVRPDGKEIVLQNGLVRRVFRIAPNAATVALDRLSTGEAFVRAVGPEATVTLDGKKYPVGGLVGQPDHAFLRPEWVDRMTNPAGAFRYTGHTVGPTQSRFAWKRSPGDRDAPWPPPGIGLTLRFAAPSNGPAGVTVDVHYELYDGVPVMAKWLTVRNGGARPVRVDAFEAERLSVVEPESIVEGAPRWREPNLLAVTDYSFGGMAQTNANRTAFWETDPEYATQVNYERKTPCLLVCRPPLGPDVDIAPGGSFETFRVFLLAHDSTDRERRGLEVRRMYRTVAPWSQDNPLMLHLTSTDPATVRTAIDQCAAVGFEMVVISFWSGLDMEDASDTNLAKFKELADYAHAKGIRLGGYSLLASRRISDEHDVVHPKTGKTGGAIYGNSPCLCSAWGARYFERVRNFLEKTGFDLLEHDGSYPGDFCASTRHPGHRGLADSQWRQFETIRDLYHWCRASGIYLNVPDWYFLAGSNKTGMGYRESNWSLPRADQQIHARQNLFDGTWEKTPSMGWMLVPLVEYQGGGPAATIEPLREHLDDYERNLQNCLGFGAQACYRGPRLFDAPETRKTVAKWVAWFKKHRPILESDVIHLRRADGREVDGVLHVNPTLSEKGLAVFFNPTGAAVTREFALPTYYTGLRKRARVRVGDGRAKTLSIGEDGLLRVPLTVPARGMSWVVLE